MKLMSISDVLYQIYRFGIDLHYTDRVGMLERYISLHVNHAVLLSEDESTHTISIVLRNSDMEFKIVAPFTKIGWYKHLDIIRDYVASLEEE